MFIYNLRLSKRNLSIVVQSNRLLTYFKLTYLHFMNKENDVQKPGNFIYVQCTYLSYSNHKRKKFSTTNVSNMWMIHYFSKLMWPLETLQRNTMALPVTSSSKWKIFSNFLAFSEYPNFTSGWSLGSCWSGLSWLGSIAKDLFHWLSSTNFCNSSIYRRDLEKIELIIIINQWS